MRAVTQPDRRLPCQRSSGFARRDGAMTAHSRLSAGCLKSICNGLLRKLQHAKQLRIQRAYTILPPEERTENQPEKKLDGSMLPVWRSGERQVSTGVRRAPRLVHCPGHSSHCLSLRSLRPTDGGATIGQTAGRPGVGSRSSRLTAGLAYSCGSGGDRVFHTRHLQDWRPQGGTKNGHFPGPFGSLSAESISRPAT